MATTAKVPVGGVQVVDASQHDVVRMGGQPAHDRARLIFALHVGGLLELGLDGFRNALKEADILYADGAAVVLLARIAGARRIERAPTTDIGVPVLQELSGRLGRPARIALVGGPVDLACRAGDVLSRAAKVEVVYTQHGYFQDDSEVLVSLRNHRPDAIVLGLGMPKEALWAYQYRDELPPSVVLTCGGWFGFLTGSEQRAPLILQRTGLEWTYRLRQHFPRLIGRYSRGALQVVRLIPSQLMRRREVRSAPRKSVNGTAQADQGTPTLTMCQEK